jgi:hypothetical protein
LLAVNTAQAGELPSDIVKHESRFMAAGICKNRGFQFIDAAGETGNYWLCLRSKVSAPNAVAVDDVLKEAPSN